jgi:hypothetical protein
MNERLKIPDSPRAPFRYVPVVLGLLLLNLSAAALQQAMTASVTEHKLTRGEHLQMELSAGEYFITGHDSDTVKVVYTADTPHEQSSAKVTFIDSNSDPEVLISNTSRHSFHASIDVPPRTNLRVRVKAGNLTIKGVAGNTDIEDRKGDVVVELINPEDYQVLDASITVGSLNAPAFHVSKLGLWRSFHHRGNGKQQLHVHVGIGSLEIQSSVGNAGP